MNFLHEAYNSNNKTLPADVIPKMKQAIAAMPGTFFLQLLIV